MPSEVNQAVIAIWITIALSVIAALVSRWLGDISSGMFAWYIITYAVFCVFPYKLRKGSNPARWIYTILFAVSILLILGGLGSDMPKADWIAIIIILPIQLFAIFRLFQHESSQWFQQS